MPRPRKPNSSSTKTGGKPDPDARLASPIRIIGGTLRGRTLQYEGDARTRPMKDRVREALFNLLGPIKGAHAIDLFAGTGALALEAISRGAISADAVEKHFPTADILKKNIESLAPAANIDTDKANAAKVNIRAGDAFYWSTRLEAPTDRPWVVFISPPYALYVSRRDDMLLLIAEMIRQAPTGSQIVVECDDQFDPFDLPRAAEWTVRTYPPAILAILRLQNLGVETTTDE